MEKDLMVRLLKQFDDIVNLWPDSQLEFWYARELQVVLGYERWENFKKVIDKAVIACETTDVTISDHFRDVTKMVKIGSGTERPIDDILLTRYACYGTCWLTAALNPKIFPPEKILKSWNVG